MGRVEARRKKTYIELIRIIAIFLVIFNHVDGYDLFAETTGKQDLVLILITMITRINVPLFLMISGAMLLGKNESYRQVWDKRVWRIVIIIPIVNILVYFVENPGVFDLKAVIEGIFNNEIDKSYWYLYAYLSFLIFLPLYHRIAVSFTKKDFLYILIFCFLIRTLYPMVDYIAHYRFNLQLDMTTYFRPPFIKIKEIFYPLFGYYIDQKLDIRKVDKRYLILFPLVTILGLLTETGFTYFQGIHSGFTEDFVECFDYIAAITVFIEIKYFMVCRNWLHHPKINNAICLLGSLTFGVYLLDPILRKMYYPKLQILLEPHIGVMLTAILWCFISLAVCSFITFWLKKIPFVKKLV